jgi:23S rRNA (cytosine1962-C5)-methyltransferase
MASEKTTVLHRAVGQPERRNRAAADALDAAIARRAPLLESGRTGAWRVLNGAADGLAGAEARPAGLVIEKYADVLIAQLHEGRLALSEPEVRALCEHAMERLHATAVYRKRFIRGRAFGADESLEAEHTRAEPWLGRRASAEFAVVENDMRMLVRPYDGFATGLYLDQRDNRRRVRDLAAGREVLNTFAYTCGFSVAAALGGAASTVSVDVSRKHLEWGKRNFAANGVAIDPGGGNRAHEFVCADVMDYLRRAARRDRRFDLIVLDPPSFGRARRPTRTFVLDVMLDELVESAWDRLRPGGVLLLSTNHRAVSGRRLEGSVARASGGQHAVVERPALPIDFSGDPDYAKSILVRRV